MSKFSFFVLVIGLICSFSCRSNIKNKSETGLINTENRLLKRYAKLFEYPLDSMSIPRSYSHKKKKIKKVPSKDWTSGFFPGNLWQIYMLTGNKDFKDRAAAWNVFIEKEKFNSGTHDMGFKIYCSFGNGIKANENIDTYSQVILRSAKTLISRYDENIGSIRSWDWNKEVWQFPVIIDNMMNLELLFEATKISGDSTFHKIAVQHAKTTMANHFRPDGSTWHVVDYDTVSNTFRTKVTHQGIADNSAWARGQGWAINGFTTVYRYTKNPIFLERAKATANYFIYHKNLPKDGIPFWDFDDPDIPNVSRDVSAAAIVASALVELYEYTNDEHYLNYSRKVATVLKTDKYLLPNDSEIPFILEHSFGDWSKREEMDEPIVYADYYFLQTLLRLKDLES